MLLLSHVVVLYLIYNIIEKISVYKVFFYLPGMGSGTSRRSGMQGFGYSPEKQGTGESDKPGQSIFCVHFCSFWCLCLHLTAGSNSLMDKIQKAAEVVASAVLPPTEHQGIRLHENHYRAVIAPSAPIEVAVPACAYNLPSCRRKGETLSVYWCSS